MVYELGTKKHVFADWDLIEPGQGLARVGPSPGDERPSRPQMHGSREMPHGVAISVHRPRIDPQRLVEPDTPCEGGFMCYVNIFEDDGLYRMYSMNCGDFSNVVWNNPYRGYEDYMLAYAESSDGVTWTKPSIGAISCNGSTSNNLVYAGHASPAFKDPSAPPEERYKLVALGIHEGKACMFGAVSPDGLRFTPLEKPVLTGYGSDTHNVIRFDPDKGRYVGYFRGKAHGNRRIRTIAYAETDRFDSWPIPEVIVTPDVNDHPDTDIYTNSYTPWPDADAHLMFPAFFQRRLDETEVHMLTSRDGLHWERPIREPVIPIGDPGSGLEGSVYAGCDLVTMRPGEWSLAISPRPTSHGQSEYPGEMENLRDRGYVCLATWRQDGFTSLETETDEMCATVPISFSGGRLKVNAVTSFGGGIRVELADASVEAKLSGSETVPGLSFDDCDAVSGNVLDHTVTWRGESDLSAWAGRPIRLRFHLHRARLHAFHFE